MVVGDLPKGEARQVLEQAQLQYGSSKTHLSNDDWKKLFEACGLNPDAYCALSSLQA